MNETVTGTRTLVNGRRPQEATGPRADPNGNARKPNAKQARKLAARIAAVPVTHDKWAQGWNTPGSQNRKK